MTTPWYDTNYTPVGGHPAALSFTAGAEILDGQLVMIEAGQDNTVIPCGAAGPYVGVAGQHVAAAGEVTVLTGAGVIHESAGTATAGQFVNPAAGGAVAGGAVGTSTVGVCTRAGDAAATPPVPVRWLSWK